MLTSFSLSSTRGTILCLMAISTVATECNTTSRQHWGATHANSPLQKLKVPVKLVVIQHTVTKPCLTDRDCEKMMRLVQKYQMTSLHHADITHSFLVGGNGKIYSGRGWNWAGAHTKGYDNQSIAISFIGNFMYELPSKDSITAVVNLLECGVRKGYLSPNYELVGHRQLSLTLSPGDKLYKEITSWKNFTFTPHKLSKRHH